MNLYIYFFDYKSGQDNKTIVDNTVYKDIQTVLKMAVQIGRAFDPEGSTYTPKEGERSLVYSSKTIDVYVLALINAE